MVKTMNQTLQREVSSGLLISPQIKSRLNETSKWTSFLAIVGFITIGFIALAAIFSGIVMSERATEFGTATESPILIASLYLLTAAAFAVPLLYLYRFAKRLRAALNSNNQEELDHSFQQLTACHRFLGAFVIIALIGIVVVTASGFGLF